ncbi:MAG TPA: ABC transporter substrate-binding protein, partial [Myxococcaceae bacterium]|nr:ABC transporter substrate-binding protein [Myxococcaceae bacterium]
LLLGRSQGQEALAAVGAPDLSSLQGRRLAVDPQGSGAYFALWLLSRAGLGAQDVRWVDLPSSLHAGPVLREGRADAVVGLRGDVERAALDRGGAVLATTADAPHLLATVLVARGDFAARYPDALRRVIRSLLDAAAIIQREPALGAQPLGEVAPYLGDPTEAVSSDPPAGLRENLAFFAISGEAPVTYAELMESASALWFKVGVAHAAAARPQETADLAVLRSLAGGRRP